MSDPHDGLTPHRYVIQHRVQHCTCCGRTHHWSELFAETTLRPQMGLGKRVTNYRRLDWPKYRIPVVQLAETKTERLPFCHACYEPSLMNSPGMLDLPVTVMAGTYDPRPLRTPDYKKPTSYPEPGVMPDRRASPEPRAAKKSASSLADLL